MYEDMSDWDEDDIPDSDTCQIIVEMFAEITGADEACAQYFLQDRSWNLERSVNAYFEATRDHNFPILEGEGVAVGKNVFLVVGRMMHEIQQQKCLQKLSVVSWNLNGIDGCNLKRRTKAVCKIMNQENADIVFLQEVIPQTFRYISNKLSHYMCIGGDSKGYFSAILLKRTSIFYESHVIIPFTGSSMERNLMNVEVHISGIKFHLFNAHLESGIENECERKSQLKYIFEEIKKVSENQTVIFGGDLNICDEELNAVGIPHDVQDVWKLCGAKQENKYTWDMMQNTNKNYPGDDKPRMRFDRLYVRYSHPRVIIAKHFGLLGMKKISCTQSYPSDHWGIRVLFEGQQLEN